MGWTRRFAGGTIGSEDPQREPRWLPVNTRPPPIPRQQGTLARAATSNAVKDDRVSDAESKSDAELIEAALGGRSESFGHLVQRYQQRLFASMYHLVGHIEEAEDVAQEAFVQSFRKLHTFQGAAGYYTWLYRIAFNIAISRRRRRRPNVSLEQRRRDGEEPMQPGEAVEAGLEREENAQRLWNALQLLSEEHRTIMVLREMEGRDYDSIAEMLGVPVGTVRSRLHRARSHLRELLKETLEEHTS